MIWFDRSFIRFSVFAKSVWPWCVMAPSWISNCLLTKHKLCRSIIAAAAVEALLFYEWSWFKWLEIIIRNKNSQRETAISVRSLNLRKMSTVPPSSHAMHSKGKANVETDEFIMVMVCSVLLWWHIVQCAYEHRIALVYRWNRAL